MNAVLILQSESRRSPTTSLFLVTGSFILGRSSKCDLVVRNDTVSRRHVEIVVSQGKVTVRDLDSRNGTFIDDMRVQTATVQEGQYVRFGKVSFLLTNAEKEVNSEEATAQGDSSIARLDPPHAYLSRAQRRVLSELREGLGEKQIARRLNLSQTTVHNHVQAIYRIFNVHSRSELFAHFLKQNRGQLESL